MKRPALTALAFLGLMLISVTLQSSASAQIQIFSTGQYGTPETMSLAPSGFGAYAGNYFIPDARTNNIWVLPAGGGPPTPFLADPIALPDNSSVIGGTFLPSGWGINSGKFLVACLRYKLLVFDAAGNGEIFDPIGPSYFANPLIAPAQFAPYAGHLFVTDEFGYVWRADPAGGGLTIFADFPNFQSGPFGPLFWFGIEFTPVDWGPFARRMLVSDAFASVDNGPGTRASYVAAVSADGAATLFATVPLKDGANGAPGQDGLRQMLMTPNDYFLNSLGIPGQVLLLSVSGSTFGGGVLGETLALDSSGTIVGHLKVGSVLAKYDPRGMIFTSDGYLLISDASDPILKVSPSDFAPGREDACQPSVTASVSIPLLWPPNHDLVNVGLAVNATDTCPGSPTLAATIFSNEGDLSASGGTGNFSPDATNIAVGTLRLRAERGGGGEGRIYLVVVKATDTLGYVAGYCSTVVVPRDESKASMDSVDVQAAAAKTFCETHAFAPPPGYVVVGSGPDR